MDFKLKSEIMKQLMRELDALVEKLNEAGETEIAGCASGWDYTFKKSDQQDNVQKPKTKLLN